MKLVLASALGMLLVCLLAGCASESQISKAMAQVDPVTSIGSPDAAATVRSTDLSVRSPAAVDQGAGRADGSAGPMLFPGADTKPMTPASADPGAAQPAAEPSSGQRTASLDPVAIRGDGVEMNFENAEIHSVAKTLLGDILQVNFVVDPRVQGTVTLSSVRPIARQDVLPAFESALRMQNAAIVHEGKFVKIVPLADAAGQAAVSVGAGEPGFGVSVVPLRYTSATTVAKTAETMLARPGAIHVDQGRNLLLIQGTTSEREAAIDVISTFDDEWLRNQSVGVYPLKSTSPETMIQELERVFQTEDGGPGQGVIRFQPITRMNAVMVVTKNPDLLKQMTQWVQRLDRSDPSGTIVRTYRLKYGNAAQVAKILNEIFTSQHSGTDDSPTNQLAPGTTTAQSRLDSLDKGTQVASAAGPAGSTPQQGLGSPQQGFSNHPSGTDFSGFSGHNNNNNNNNNADDPFHTTSSGGGLPKGVFQNVRITPDTINNTVLVYSNQEDYRVIERALRDFDRPRLQVAIEATVAEVTLTNELTYGVQYFLAGKSVGLVSAASAVAQTAAPAAAVPALQPVTPGFNLLLGNQANPSAILNALSTITSVKVLSSPSIVALDNEPALLEVGDQVPISTGSATILTGANTPVVNTIELHNTGVILKVLPHVNANGTVQLEVDQEISNVVNSTTGASSSNTATSTLTPTISERRIHSTVAVTSGQTVLLGGLISDSDQNTQAGVPGLNQIKFLGALFGNTDHTKQRSEIIIFIKPQLIRNSVDARAVTEEFRERLQSMKTTRSVITGSDVPTGPEYVPPVQKPLKVGG
jgi:general secretion pathway protein D